jgi:hypothetical protein
LKTEHFPVLVVIESDATRYHGEHPQLPQLLDRARAEQLLAHLASDLQALFPRLQPFSLAMAGALYDQSQLLRPGWPQFSALESLAMAAANRASRPGSQLLSIGAHDGRMPDQRLQPDPQITPAALQLLPVLISGPEPALVELAEAMEHRFIAEGQVSAHTAMGLKSAFGITLVHARFMTVNDLLAMLHLQLEHLGVQPLWQLLDAALHARSEPLSVVGRMGQSFSWDGRQVRCEFETFDAFARRDPADAEDLPQRYAAWLQEYRQYLLALAAHCVPLVQHLPGADTPLDGTFLVESVPWAGQADACAVTEQACNELGVVAVTVAIADQLLNFYPLSPQGLDDLHRHIRQAGHASGGLAYPGELVFDPGNRSLAPECGNA